MWREKADGDWSRAAFPIMLVNDTENHAHQGLATFLYKNGEVTDLRLQFVQHTGPYSLKTHFVAWGSARATLAAGNLGDLDARRAKAKAELADRMPAKPWSELVQIGATGNAGRIRRSTRPEMDGGGGAGEGRRALLPELADTLWRLSLSAGDALRRTVGDQERGHAAVAAAVWPTSMAPGC